MDRIMENNMQKLDAISNNATINNNNMEAETMANENNRNMDNIGAMDAMPYGDIVEDGQAVTGGFPECTDLIAPVETVLQKKKKPVTGITATTEFIGEMDDYDRAVEPEIPYARKSTALNKEARIITDKLGRVLCAWIKEDENKNKKVIAVQKYMDGTYSPEMKIKKSDIIMSSIPNKGEEDVIQKKVKKFLLNLFEEYTNKFNGQNSEVLKASEIIEMLNAEMRYMPVYEDDYVEMERMEFHKKVLEIAKTLTTQVSNDHKGYYPLMEQDVVYIARECGLDKLGLLRRLKQYDLLYLQKSSRGFQSNIRIKYDDSREYTAWRYCLLRDATLENNGDYCDYYDF